MSRPNDRVFSCIVAVLTASLVGYWGWALADAADSPELVAHCSTVASVQESCLIDEPARVDSLPPVWRFVIGPNRALGPTYGVRLTGLPTGPGTVYFVGSDYHRLALRSGEAVTASTLHGAVVEVSDMHGSAFVNGASRRDRIGRIPAAFPL